MEAFQALVRVKASSMSDQSANIVGVSRSMTALRLDAAGRRETTEAVAEEVPLALHYNGFPHAVMMVTPADLKDFVWGFSLTEGLIHDVAGICGFRLHSKPEGLLAEIKLSPECLHRFLAARRVRRLEGRTSCGLCGVEDLADLKLPSRALPPNAVPSAAAIQTAANKIRDFQPLSRDTRAAHASAWVDLDGNILAVREDVGRHNSLDKLIGANLLGSFRASAGFCLITSRCSFEMAQKAILAGFSTLVSVSAPTAYAVHVAQRSGLALYSLSHDGGHLLYSEGRTAQEENT